MKILFVCSGNTCRSPLALAAWRSLQKLGRAPKHVEAQSAGLSSWEGSPAAKHSVAVARQWGDDLSTHASQSLTAELIQDATAIFAMSPDHLYSLREYFDVAPEKIHLLGAFDSDENNDENDEILDPFGGSREAYETCAARIYRAVEGVASAINRGELSR